MEKENNKNKGLIADYEERKQRLEAFSDLNQEKLNNAVYNLQNALEDEHRCKDSDLLKVLLNDVILQAFSYFETLAQKNIINDDSILLNLAK